MIEVCEGENCEHRDKHCPECDHVWIAHYDFVGQAFKDGCQECGCKVALDE